MEVVQISTRINKEDKLMAQEVLEREGLDIPTLIKIVITKTAREGKIPVHFNQAPCPKSQHEIEVNQRLSEVLAPRIKQSKHIDLKDPEQVNQLLEGWD